ncbi:MAG TPA: carboxypeptidase-like regulatory domain-containing protein, partial [Candidatus Binatia bacterium]|nr:carboxypeptidase-like regulatory domain-containing protein [Candidatus Binatia bacterium]
MTTRLLARASVLFVLLFALCGAAFANNSWIGTLLDAGGKPVTGAAVHLHSNSHDYESRTNGAGEFHFESLEAGEYRLMVTLDGKTWALAASLSITDGAPLNASVVLSAENQTLALRSKAESRGSGGEHLSSGEVSSLPLNTR